MKKVKALLLSLLSISVIGMAIGCGNPGSDSSSSDASQASTGSVSDSSLPDSSLPDSSLPDSSLPDSSLPDSSTTPSPFDGIEFSDPAVVIPAAYALEVGAVLDGTYTLKGQIVSSNGYNSQYGDISVTIAVEGYEDYPIYCWQIKNDADKIGLGDYIAVQGKIKNFEGTVEFEKPTMLAYEAGEYVPNIDINPAPGTGLSEGYNVITIRQALEIAKVQKGEPKAYYIHATIASITDTTYGKMILEDATGTISVYGTYGANDEYFNVLDEQPKKGDEVLVACTLQLYQGTAEVKKATLVAFKSVQQDESEYTEMSIAQARDAQKGDKVKVTGVVATITYASGMAPNGVYLVDGTNAIYVFDRDLAGSVEVGNTVTILAEKDWWILEDEVNNAAKYNYKGCNQLTNAYLVENDGLDADPDYTWVEETTMKAIMDTPVSTDITTTIYKVNALVKRSQGTGFVNYYINDFDGKTGSYAYTQCDGNDLAWLAQYDGKLCTLYISVINAKSSATGCVWRFKVLEVVADNYQFDMENVPQFVLDYYATAQFEAMYTADPEQEMLTSVDSDVLGFEGAELSYASADTNIVYFTTDAGKTVMHMGETVGKTTVTITATYNGFSATATVEVENAKAPDIDYITVAQAITTAVDTDITVKGIVGPSLVNQVGFYLFGEDGSVIAVRVASNAEFETLEIGHEVILSGTRMRVTKDPASTTYFGQSCINNATILVNNKGKHEYSTARAVTNRTIAQVSGQSLMTDYTTTLYVLTGTLTFPSGYGQVSINDDQGNKIGFYSGSVNQYSYLNDYKGQVVTLEIILCNWNNKNYWTGCAIAIRLADGTKILNPLYFDTY